MRGAKAAFAAVLVAVGLAVAAVAFAGAKPTPKSTAVKKVGNGVTAYVYVVPGEVSLNIGPTLVASRTRNFVAVTEPRAGVFCLRAATSVDAATESWTVTPEVARSTAPATRAMFAYADEAACPAGYLGVRTFELTGGVLAPSEHVAFMVVAG